MRSSVTRNLYYDGRPYLKGILGLSLLPSTTAQKNKDNYEADMDWIVKNINRTFVGSQVLLQIALHSNKNVVIQPRPLNKDEQNEDEFSRLYNASTYTSSLKDATKAGEDAPAFGKEPWEDRTKGSGLGSDVLIMFNPGVYEDAMGAPPADKSDRVLWGRMGRSDWVLLHELVHAMSDVSGVQAESMAGPAHYGNLEEFTAVVIANVYQSETSGGMPTTLVGGHDGTVLPLLLYNSEAFYKRYKPFMDNVCRNHSRLARQLKTNTKIAHNPFIYCNV